MHNYLSLPAPKKKLLLTSPNKFTKKWQPLLNKLSEKKRLYLEGVKRYGTVGEAMLYAGIKSRTSLRYYRAKDKKFAEAEIKFFEDNNDVVCDMAEKQLFLAIKNGELQAIKYFLDRRSSKYKPTGRLEVDDKRQPIEQVNINIIRNRDEVKSL